MLFQFSPEIQAGIEAGKYAIPTTKAGIPFAMARNVETGQFVAHAVGAVTPEGYALNPVALAPQLAMGGQFLQGGTGVQALNSLSSSVSVLQATTAVIGVGTALTAALTAVNLWQTLKLRQDVKMLRREVNEGFLDLKQLLSAQGTEIIQHIERVAQDVEFGHHRTILSRAYGLFEKALLRLKSAIVLQDPTLRNDEITASRNMLFQALSDYDNKDLLENVCSAAYLRRRECVWAIEQSIAMTYQMQAEYGVVGDRLSQLNLTMRHDALQVIDNRCETVEELDFLFPEITRICNQDLAIIESWQAQVEWCQALPKQELQLFLETSNQQEKSGELVQPQAIELLPEKQPEYMLYEEMQEKSHPRAIQVSLVMRLSPESRQDCEMYVSEQAQLVGLKALNLENLQRVSTLALANLTCYFEAREEPDELEGSDLLEAANT